MPFRNPRDILKAYNEGFKGVQFDRKHFDKLVSNLKYASFRDAARRILGSGEGKLSTPYKSVFKLSKETPYLERQTTGDCVSHATRNAIDVTRAVQIDIKGMAQSFMALGATEGIYGSRGHGGQGMSCSGAAEWVHSKGGVLLRKKYSAVDLSTYDGDIGARWGSRGIPAEVTEEAAKHKVKTIIPVNSLEDVRDALANGYGVAVCSGQGFSSTRDSKGFAKPQGSWSHAMQWMACDDTNGEMCFLVQNSWGKWNDGGHPEWGPIPDGSFLIHADVAKRMIESDGSFAFSNVDGFPPQELPDYGTQEYL